MYRHPTSKRNCPRHKAVNHICYTISLGVCLGTILLLWGVAGWGIDNFITNVGIHCTLLAFIIIGMRSRARVNAIRNRQKMNKIICLFPEIVPFFCLQKVCFY